MVTDIKKKKFNNSARIADSKILSFAKLIYYKVLIYFYGVMGKRVDFCWANSTWTRDHMAQLWLKWADNFKIL
jgi:alpha-1,2-mannosyltransferase